MQRLFICLLVLITFCALMILFFPLILEEPQLSNLQRYIEINDEMDDDVACRWPKFDPQNASITSLIGRPDKPACEKGFRERLVFADQDGYLAVNNEYIAIVSYLAEHPIACSYSYFDSASYDQSRLVYSGQIEFYSFMNGKPNLTSVKLTEGDFVRVQCYQRGKKSNVLYVNSYSYGTLTNKRRSTGFLQYSPRADQRRFSILVIAFDGVSLPAFQRHMPSTYAYLTDSSMRAHVFRGFTKVALDSNTNLMAMLTGKRTPTSILVPKNASIPFIWKEFDGYATTFHEDSVTSGLFSERRFDFMGKPTDFYFRPYYTELKRLRPKHPYCGGHKTISETQLEALERQLKLLDDTMQFNAVYMGEMIRENTANLELMDAAFLGFLKRMNNVQFWERTVLFLVGTRGPESGRFRQSLPGVFEERMPLLVVRAPRRLLDQSPGLRRRLAKNQHRLVTHFDVYATFKHLLEMSKNFDRPDWNQTKSSTGVSLFESIPADRTCEQAGVPYQFCPCQRVEVLPISEGIHRAALEFVEHINEILEQHSIFNGSKSYRASAICWKFSLDRVVRSERFHLDGSWRRTGLNHQRHILSPEQRTRLRLLIRCNPGDAIFEAELVPRSLYEWSIASEISRLDRPGDHSYCVQDEKVKPFCICSKPRKG